MKRLIVRAPFLAGELENEVLEACITNPSSDDVWEGVVLRPGPTEVPSTFEGVGVKLKKQPGKYFYFYSISVYVIHFKKISAIICCLK